jgi:hypothetical protein
MATSESSSEPLRWEGGAMLVPDRPDLVWPVREEVATALRALWQSLPEAQGDIPATQTTGYRGAYLRSADEEWFAYGGVVVQLVGHELHRRADPRHRFESMLLNTAPRGTLPSWMITPPSA